MKSKGRRIECPYHILLIPAEGNAKRLSNACQTISLAEYLGNVRAGELFPMQAVEIVVIHTRTSEAVSNTQVCLKVRTV